MRLVRKTCPRRNGPLRGYVGGGGHDGGVVYRERSAGIPGVVLWERSIVPSAARSRILPDGCLDLIWDGRELTIAGPDPEARWHEAPAGTAYTALRFHQGTGPAALGIPASALVGQAPGLAEVWTAAAARELAERVEADPAGALAAWAALAVTGDRVDPIARPVHALARRGAPVAHMADRLGLSARQLQRRCQDVFGYGPRRLSRILRLSRALDQARAGVPLADVAAGTGYADQAHLTREVRALVGATPTELMAELAAPLAAGG
jgi:AraC-like DNA-binding protein